MGLLVVQPNNATARKGTTKELAMSATTTARPSTINEGSTTVVTTKKSWRLARAEKKYAKAVEKVNTRMDAIKTSRGRRVMDDSLEMQHELFVLQRKLNRDTDLLVTVTVPEATPEAVKPYRDFTNFTESKLETKAEEIKAEQKVEMAKVEAEVEDTRAVELGLVDAKHQPKIEKIKEKIARREDKKAIRAQKRLVVRPTPLGRVVVARRRFIRRHEGKIFVGAVVASVAASVVAEIFNLPVTAVVAAGSLTILSFVAAYYLIFGAFSVLARP